MVNGALNDDAQSDERIETLVASACRACRDAVSAATGVPGPNP
jgi:hypothetical protein